MFSVIIWVTEACVYQADRIMHATPSEDSDCGYRRPRHRRNPLQRNRPGKCANLVQDGHKNDTTYYSDLSLTSLRWDGPRWDGHLPSPVLFACGQPPGGNTALKLGWVMQQYQCCFLVQWGGHEAPGIWPRGNVLARDRDARIPPLYSQSRAPRQQHSFCHGRTTGRDTSVHR